MSRRRAGPAAHHPLQHRGHQVRDLGLDHLLALGLVLVQDAFVLRGVLRDVRELHPPDGPRVAALAVVRERPERRRHVHRRDLLDAERDRGNRVQGDGDPHPVRRVDDVLGSDVERELREDDVHRVLRRAPQVQVPAVAPALRVAHAAAGAAPSLEVAQRRLRRVDLARREAPRSNAAVNVNGLKADPTCRVPRQTRSY